MQVPEISVLMGTYNEKKEQVVQAIDSVLNQSFSDFEFIICDDGSEESFYRWLQSYCRRDNRIRLIRNKKNQGLAAALNQGLGQASGKYIARMDADDISKKERFERQYAFLESHSDYVLTGCCAQLFGTDGVWGVRKVQQKPDAKSFLQTSPFIHPTVMMHRSVAEKLHGYCERPGVRRVEDYDFFMRLYAAGYRGWNLQEVLFMYREDMDALRKRRYCFRLHECRVRYQGYRRLGILKGNLRYVLKPLLAGLLPMQMMKIWHKKLFGTGIRRVRDQ